MDDISGGMKGNEKEAAFNALNYGEKEGPKDREVLVALSKAVHGLFDGLNLEKGRTALVNVKTKKVTYITENVIRPFYRKQAIRN